MPGVMPGIGLTRRILRAVGVSPIGPLAINRLQFQSTQKCEQMRMWRSGSASPCQGEGREFESRHPLEWEQSVRRWLLPLVEWPRG